MKSWTPHNYQIQAMRFLLEHACGALFLDPGLGKTSITLGAIKILKNKGVIKKVLVVAPLRVCHSVWPREVQEWSDFSELRVSILHGKNKDAALATPADIYVINPEGLPWLFKSKKVKYETRGGKQKTRLETDERYVKSLGFDLLVIDELSKFKSHDKDRFKGMRPLVPLFTRRWGLTGTPVSNGYRDLWAQCYLLDEGRALGSYVSHYLDKYFSRGRDGFTYQLNPGADEAINERIEPLTLRMGTELIDMPELVSNVVRIDLPPAAMEVYNKFERDFIAGFDDGLVTAGNAAVKSGKLRQIASGGVFLDQEEGDDGLLVRGPRKWKNIHIAKVEALQDLHDEVQGAPLLVAYDFEHDLDRLRKAFPKAVYACDYSAKQFPMIEKMWNDGSIDMLFGHPAAIGHGLNLQKGPGSHVVFHTLGWDFDHYDQFRRRVWRQGFKGKRVFVHHLLAHGTIDEVIYYAILGKKSVQDALFQWLAERRKRRSR